MVYQKARTLPTSWMVTLQGNSMLCQQRSVAAVSPGSLGADVSTFISQHSRLWPTGQDTANLYSILVHIRNAPSSEPVLSAHGLQRPRNSAQRKGQPFLWPEAGLFTMHDLASKVHTGIQPTHPPASYLFSAPNYITKGGRPTPAFLQPTPPASNLPPQGLSTQHVISC